MNIAIIFAGGTGRRMNSGALPKQFLEFRGKPIIIYTLELFDKHPEIDYIVVVCIEDWIPFLHQKLDEFEINKVKMVVPGGENSQDSIRNGLEAAATFAPEEAIVLIHDGVRPLIDYKTISDNIDSVKTYGSAITVVPAFETFIIKEKEGIYIPERSDSLIARAPQSFRLGDILRLQNRSAEEGMHNFIDCCSLMNYYGHSIHTVEGPRENIKITTPSDFFIFKTLVEIKENRQIYGF